MKVFTYNEYIKCIHTLRLNAVLQLAEEGTEYHLEDKNKKYSYDKLIKNILQNEKEAEKFINKFIRPKNPVEAHKLVKYTNNYITKKYKYEKAKLIYKLYDKDVFFLIEHQSNINNSMPYKILNYCIDIMQEWNINKKIGKNIGYPIIVPIVIYTGNEKWKMPKNLKEKQISTYVFERNKIHIDYNLVDINKIPKQVLLEQDTMFGYIMLIEKSKDKEELIDNLGLIIKSIDDKEKLNELENLIDYLLNNALEEGIKQELLRKINKKVGEKNMCTLYDRLLDENKRILKKGEKQGKREIAKNMINKKFEDKMILEITGIKKEELETIKNNIPMAV